MNEPLTAPDHLFTSAQVDQLVDAINRVNAGATAA
jgi:hypothetical protein